MTTSSRLFFALWPDEQTQLKLIRLNQSLDALGFKLVMPHNLHATLVFLGTVDAGTELLITHSILDIYPKPFELKFDQLSFWSKPKILCLTCSQMPVEIESLVAALDSLVASFGLQIEARPYAPHITLARHAHNLPDIKFKPIVFRPQAFVLAESCSESEGVNYKIRQQWPISQDN
jgi:2'-5' RNA ligase